jgi:hypothetical protein
MDRTLYQISQEEMTPRLRKYHRLFWLAAAAILPILFIGAVTSIPKPIADPRFHIFQPDPLPVVAREQQVAQFLVRLRSDVGGSNHQVEVIIKKPLSVPEALVYLTEKGTINASSGILIGKLSSVGAYRFAMTSDAVSPHMTLHVVNPFDNTTIHPTQF